MKYEFMQRHTHEFSVRMMCRVLQVSASGYYASIDRQPSVTELRRQALNEAIQAIHMPR